MFNKRERATISLYIVQDFKSSVQVHQRMIGCHVTCNAQPFLILFFFSIQRYIEQRIGFVVA